MAVAGQVARLLSKKVSKPRKVDKLLDDMPSFIEDLIIPEMKGVSWVTKEEAKQARKNFQKFVDDKFDETGTEDPKDLLILAELDDIIEGNVKGVKPSDEILGRGWEGEDVEAFALRFTGDETEREMFQRSFIPSYDNWASKKEDQVSSWLTNTEAGKRFQLENLGQIITPVSDTPLMKKGATPTTNELDTMRKLKTDNTSDVTLRDIDRYDFKKGGKADFPDLTGDGKVTRADVLKGRGVFQEGGDVNTQMEMMLGGVEESPMVPDEQMEEDYVDYVVEETLSNEDRNYLIDALEKDDRLSEIFDQVVESATEFTGAGTVEGPGTGKSDSIPARLSDGEFVFTAKATEELGADNLMSMMREAEREADERLQAQEGGLIEEEETVTMPVEKQPVEQDIRVTKETVGSQAAMQEQSDLVDEELKKSMLSTRPYVRS